MKACRCGHCGQVIPAESLIETKPDGDWCFTLEDDEPTEWLCPICLNGDVPAGWVTFYLPGEPIIVEAAQPAKAVQGELF